MKTLPQNTSKYEQLLSLEKIMPDDLRVLSPDEKAAFMKELYQQLNTVAGRQLNMLVQKVKAILDNELVWQLNHNNIMNTIRKHVDEYGTVPSNTYLAAACILSRKTIIEHLKTYKATEEYAEQNDAMGLMRHNVMGMVLKASLRGDLKASKLFLDATREPEENEASVNTRNNFVQINKTIINQQIIQQLRPEQLQRIEQIIAENEGKSAQHKPS